MSTLHNLRTLSYPLTRSLTHNTTNKSPLLTSISVHRLSNLNISAVRAGFSTQAPRQAASHDDHYDPPTGWLFGVPPGEKYENEGWERIWVWGFWGSLAVGAVGYAFKPDTSIQTWALEEARRRLEAEGILPDPDATTEPGNKD